MYSVQHHGGGFMSSLSAHVVGLRVDQVSLLPIDSNEHLEKRYNRLYRDHMRYLKLTATLALDPNDSKCNDRLLMDILDALSRIQQHEDVPERLAFDSLEARVKDNCNALTES
jgi:hypothetical protein